MAIESIFALFFQSFTDTESYPLVNFATLDEAYTFRRVTMLPTIKADSTSNHTRFDTPQPVTTWVNKTGGVAHLWIAEVTAPMKAVMLHANMFGKLATRLGGKYTNQWQEGLEALFVKRWLSLVDISPLAIDSATLYRIFMLSRQAHLWITEYNKKDSKLGRCVDGLEFSADMAMAINDAMLRKT